VTPIILYYSSFTSKHVAAILISLYFQFEIGFNAVERLQISNVPVNGISGGQRSGADRSLAIFIFAFH
jgi:hypothetical protein